jgi:hypothetical protein
MSSSNLAVRPGQTAKDALSHPAYSELRAAANDERAVRNVRPRTSFTNRKLVVRDQDLRLFRIR